jgi:aspartate racemase
VKTVGLLGGMSWESTATYYRLLNDFVKARLGGLHSAKIVLVSVDFHEVEGPMQAGDWDRVGASLAQAARQVQAGGAECLLLCTNTMHRVAPAIEAAIDIPFLHIAEPTARAMNQAGHDTVGLLGTRATMEQAFYRDYLASRGIGTLVPDAADRDLVHRIIFEELCLGIVTEASRDEYRRVMRDLAERGAQAIVLGCTEISLLVGAADSAVPLFDTTALHAGAAVDWALSAPP